MTRHIMLTTLVILLAGSLSADVITFDDLYSLPRISDPQISPDSRQIAFVLGKRDVKTGGSESHIWIMNSDGSDLRQLTNGENGESHPRWSPNGRFIAFHANRGDGRQVWLLPTDGGEAWAVTSLSTGAGGMKWSPTGDKFAFSSTVYPDCRSDSCNIARQAEVDSNPVKARLYDHLLYRHYKYWFDGTTERIFICDIDRDTVYQLTFTHDNAPVSPIGGHSDYVFSRTGREIFASRSSVRP